MHHTRFFLRFFADSIARALSSACSRSLFSASALAIFSVLAASVLCCKLPFRPTFTSDVRLVEERRFFPEIVEFKFVRLFCAGVTPPVDAGDVTFLRWNVGERDGLFDKLVGAAAFLFCDGVLLRGAASLVDLLFLSCFDDVGVVGLFLESISMLTRLLSDSVPLPPFFEPPFRLISSFAEFINNSSRFMLLKNRLIAASDTPRAVFPLTLDFNSALLPYLRQKKITWGKR